MIVYIYKIVYTKRTGRCKLYSGEMENSNVSTSSTQKGSNRITSETVVNAIQKKILDGDLRVGDVLPSEREMVEMFNIGRPALREALKALESIGLVERRHGKGNYITNNVENALAKQNVLSYKLGNGQPEDILELRYMVESYTVTNAAKKATPEDVEVLWQIHEQMIAADDPVEKSKLDRALHSKIAEISNNPLVLDIINEASALLDAFSVETIRLTNFAGNSLQNIYSEHFSLIKAIENHNATEAFIAIDTHLSHVNVKFMTHK